MDTDTSTPQLINDLFKLREDKLANPRTNIKIGHAIARLTELDAENRELRTKIGLIHSEVRKQLEKENRYT